MSENSIDKNTIMAWLADEDFEVHLESVPPQAPLEWIIRVTSKIPVSANVIIQQPKDKKDRIVITLGVIISDYHKSKMRGLNDKSRSMLVYDIVRDLSSLCPECFLLVQPSITSPESIVMTRILYSEEVNRVKVVNTVKILINMFSLLVIKLTSMFGPYQQPYKSTGTESIGFM